MSILLAPGIVNVKFALDPVYNNFVLSDDEFCLIDMDQAKVHTQARRACWFMGKELANIRLKVINKDRALWRVFIDEYKRLGAHWRTHKSAFRLGFWWWYWKKLYKYVVPVWLGLGYREEGRNRRSE